MSDKRAALDRELLAAHALKDIARLANLYEQAANLSENGADIDAACFYLTHAYVFALEGGLPNTADINSRLHAYGREALL